MAERILRMRDLRERTGMARSTLYRRLDNDPSFPRPRSIGGGLIGFLESEVEEWITSRPVLRTSDPDPAA